MFSEAGSQMYELSQRTGATVEDLSSLAYAAEVTGSSVQGLEMAFKKMEEAISKAVHGDEEAQMMFARLGLSASGLQRLNPAEAFRKIGAGIGGMKSQYDKAAEAKALLGKQGLGELPMLMDLAKLEQRARDLGFVMSTESAHAAHEFHVELLTLWMGVKKVTSAIGGALAPILQGFATLLVNGTAAVIRVGISLVGLSMGVHAVSVAVGILNGFLAVLNLLIAPEGLLVVGIATAAVAALAGGAVFLYYSGALRELGGVFRQTGSIIVSTWRGMQDALEGGNLGLMGQILWVGIKDAFIQGIIETEGLWGRWLANLQTIWGGVFSYLHESIGGIFGDLIKLGSAILEIRQSLLSLTGGKLPIFWALDKAGGLLGMPQLPGAAEHRQENLDWLKERQAAGGKELQDLLEQASREAEASRKKMLEGMKPPGLSSLEMHSQGSFNPFAAPYLSAGNTLSAIADSAKKTAENTEEIIRKMGGQGNWLGLA
jgi:hypothetical protein